MPKFALESIRRQPLRYLAIFFAIFSSVALSVGTVMSVSSLKYSVEQLYSQPYAHADAVAQVRGISPEELDAWTSSLEHSPDIHSVAVDRGLNAFSLGKGPWWEPVHLEQLSDGPLRWQQLQEGQFPTNPGEVAVVASSDGPRLGDELKLSVDEEQFSDVTARVVGVIKPTARDQLIGATTVFGTREDISAWASSQQTFNGEVRIAAAPGVDPGTVRSAAQEQFDRTEQQFGSGKSGSPRMQVQSGAARSHDLAQQYLGQRNHYFILLDAFILATAIVACFIVFTAYQLVAQQRQREFAQLRVIGASRGQILGSIMVEVAGLSALASLLAIPVGWQLGKMGAAHSSIFGVRIPLDFMAQKPAYAVLIAAVAIGCSLLAAVPAGIRGIYRPVISSLREDSSQNNARRGQVVLGVLGAIAIAASILVSRAIDLPSLSGQQVRTMVALALAGTGVLGSAALCVAVISLITRQLARHVSLVWVQLPLNYAAQQFRRSSTIAGIAFLAVALIGAVNAGQHKVSDHLMITAQRQTPVDLVLTGVHEPVAGDLHDVITTNAGVDGVETVGATRVQLSGMGSDDALVMSSAQLQHVSRDQGALGPHPGELVLGRLSPLRNGAHDGDRVDVHVGQASVPVTLRLAPAKFTMIAPDVMDEVTGADPLMGRKSELPAAALIRLKGEAPNEDSVAFREFTHISQQGEKNRLSLINGLAERKDSTDVAHKLRAASSVMTVAALAIAVVGILNTIMLALRERRNDVKLLRRLGVGARGRWGMIAIEFSAILIPAIITGWFVGTYGGDWVASTLVS